MEPTKKLCTTCRHCHAHPELLQLGESRLNQYQCFHPNNIRAYSVIDGSPIFTNVYCVAQRVGISGCRESGTLWEAKPTEVPANATIKQVLKIKVGTDLLTDLGL